MFDVTPGHSYTITMTNPAPGYNIIDELGIGTATTPSSSTATTYNSITVPVGNANVTVPVTMTPAPPNQNQQRSGRWALRADNPPPPEGCTNKIALVFDLSASISEQELDIYKSAASQFVRTLTGVNVNVQVFTFGTTAPAPGGGSNGGFTGDTSTPAGVQDLVRQINNLILPSTVPGIAAQFTNWDAGLNQVANAASGVPFNEVIMMTDGDPTAYGTNATGSGAPGVTTSFQDVENGIFSANRLKMMDSRIVAVGLTAGGSGSVANLQAISGPEENSDFFTLPFDQEEFTNLLEHLALANCATLGLVKSAEPPTFSDGDTIHYTYTVTNTSPDDGFALHNITVSDDRAGTITDCVHENGGEITAENPLQPGESATCTATTTADQSDVDAGQIVNTATARGTTPNDDPVESGPADATVTSDRETGISITKEGSPNPFDQVGQIITYHYVITNTGNVTLHNVMVTDDKIGTDHLDCTPPNDGMATLTPAGTPHDTMTCTATYSVTQADLDAGHIMNTATATGTPPPGLEPPTDEATENIESNAAPEIMIVKDASPKTYTTVGQVIHYTYTVTNTGPVTLNNVQVSDDQATDVACTPPIGSSLAPNASLSCTASHTVTQEDLDSGAILNTATTTGTSPAGEDVTDSATAEVTALGAPMISITKSPDPQTYSTVGQEITYTYTVNNPGPVPLVNVTVTDNRLGEVSCPLTELGVGEHMTCTATHAITQADLDAGSIPNIATAKGEDEDGREATDQADATIVAEVAKGIEVTKTAEPTTYSEVGQVIHYTYVVTNVGGVTLSNVTLSDNTIPAEISCEPPQGDSLAPGEHMTCTATHTVTQADLDAGSIANVATATGKPPEGDKVTDEADATVTATVTENLLITKTASPMTYRKVGQVITYTFHVVNASNVTLTNVVVNDDHLGTITCPQTQLAPAEAMTCTATHTITEVDLDEGSLPNSVTAEGRTPSGQPEKSLPAEEVVTELRPPVVPVTG